MRRWFWILPVVGLLALIVAAACDGNGDTATEEAAPTATLAPSPTSSPTVTPAPTPTPTPEPEPTPTPEPQPTPAPTSPPEPQPTTAPQTNCDPSYPGVCIPVGAADYDCAGGSGNGPNYIAGPIRVLPPDPHGLDRDGNGWGCE